MQARAIFYCLSFLYQSVDLSNCRSEGMASGEVDRCFGKNNILTDPGVVDLIGFE
jgi:hypothetical protein